MLIGIIFGIWFNFTTVTVDDSALAVMQQAKAPACDTIAAIFKTLDDAWRAEKNRRKTIGAYLTYSVISEEDVCPSPQEFEKQLGCRLDPSLITQNNFRITIGIRPPDECPESTAYTDRDYWLVIAFFNPNDSLNLPIARVGYCSASKKIYHDYTCKKIR